MKNFLLNYIWQLPLIVAAHVCYLLHKKDIVQIIKKQFYKVYICNIKGGITLGDKVFISKLYSSNYLPLVIAHESGHVKQSKYLGPFYLFIIGIPSILWAATHKYIAPNKSYYSFPTESSANKLGGVDIDNKGKLIWKI